MTHIHTYLWVDGCEVSLRDGQHPEAAALAELRADAVQVARLGGHLRVCAGSKAADGLDLLIPVVGAGEEGGAE